MSLASSEAAEARRLEATALGHYDLKLGPSVWRLASGLGVQYDTNIRLQEEAKADFIFIPHLEAQMRLPITDKNSLNLRVSGGYDAYSRYPEFNRWFIHPGSELAFDVYAGKFWVNLHDRFSITTDNYQDPTAVGVGDYSQLLNDAGVSIVWDLNNLVSRFGYDHLDYLILSGYPGQPNARQEVLSLATGYPFHNDSEMGIEAGGGFMHYDSVSSNALYTDATQWNVGPYLDLQLTDYIRARLSAGYTVFMPDEPNVDDFTGFYAQLALSHRVNQYVTYRLTGSRSVQFALFGGTIALDTMGLHVDWRVLHHFTLGTGFSIEHGEYLGGYQETFERYGPNLSLARRLGEQVEATLSYQFYDRSSDAPDLSYAVHIVTLNFKYQF